VFLVRKGKADMLPEPSSSDYGLEVTSLKEQVANLASQLEQERNFRIQLEEKLKAFETGPPKRPPPLAGAKSPVGRIFFENSELICEASSGELTATKTCGRCKAKVKEVLKFCNHCGNKFV
jgi:hypothetical protein